MPTLLPEEPHAKTIGREQSSDGLAVSAALVGIFGLLLAGIVHFTAGDKFIVSYVLFVTAALVAVILRWDADPPPSD